MPSYGYVSPEQMMADRANYARKGIARGRSLVALSSQDGIVICAENTSGTLRKISEVYDRIAFAGAGKYIEFEQLRMGGVRHADFKGYYYSRRDVDAQTLANLYAQLLGVSFTHEFKPMEVEVLVMELGDVVANDRIFQIIFDGTINDQHNFAVIGGETEAVRTRMEETWQPEANLSQALSRAVQALAGDDRTLTASDLEVGLLDRSKLGGRTFSRLQEDEIAQILAPSKS